MNSHSNKDPLDQLLTNWSESREPQPSERQALQQRIVSALREESEPSAAGCDIRNAQEIPSTKSCWYLSVAITAAAMLLVALTLRLQEKPPVSKGPEVFTESAAWQSPERLQHHATVYRELQQLFDQKIRCVAESGETLSFELMEENELPDSEGSQPLLIRIVLQRRVPGSQHWTPVSNVDVVSQPEQVCQVPLGSSLLRLWAFRLPDGMILIESGLETAEGTDPQMAASQLLPQGEFREVLSVVRDGVEYRVIESAVVLKG